MRLLGEEQCHLPGYLLGDGYQGSGSAGHQLRGLFHHLDFEESRYMESVQYSGQLLHGYSPHFRLGKNSLYGEYTD